jgi:hypothetical protein
LGEFLQIIIWNLRLLLGPQPDKHLHKNAFNQLEDFLDRYPVCFQQANHSQERIIAGLRSRQ